MDNHNPKSDEGASSSGKNMGTDKALEPESKSNYDKDDHCSVEMKAIKKQFRGVFDSFDDRIIDSFAVSAQAPKAPNPGLFVHNVGLIGMPLSERDAQTLANASHQAPFGMGSQTIVDTSVRRSWELNASQFEFRNPQWDAFIASLTGDIAKGLGVPGLKTTMKLELYKMLLYKKGAFFDKHREYVASQAEGMFATLVVALPSEHTGGEVEASFGDRTLTLETSSSSAFGYSWLAWYADVEHAVRPVTEGYRLVLTYNIIHTADTPIPAPTLLDDDKVRLGHAIDSWTRLCSQDQESNETQKSLSWNKLAYKLSHKYTDANLRLAHLKGKDRVKAMLIKDVCEPRGYKFLLANIEKTVEGCCDEADCEDDYWGGHRCWGGPSRGKSKLHEIVEVIEEDRVYKTVVDEHGKKIVKDVPLEMSDMVQPKVFTRDPDKEDYSGYTGNEGVSATHFYRNTCVVIVPREAYFEFIFQAVSRGNMNISAWFDTMLSDYQREPNTENRKNLVSFCRCLLKLIEKPPTWRLQYLQYGLDEERLRDPYSDETLILIVRAAAEVREPKYIEQAVKVSKRKLPLTFFSGLGNFLCHVKWADCISIVQMAFETLDTIQDRYRASENLHLSLESGATDVTENVEALKQWIENRYPTMLKVEKVSGQDAEAVIDIASASEEKFMFQSILPGVKTHIHCVGFITRFLNGLVLADEQHKLRHEVALNVFQDVLSDFASEFSLSELAASKKAKIAIPPSSIFSGIRSNTNETEAASDVSGQDLAQLIRNCHHLGTSDSAEKLLDKIQAEAEKLDTSCFGSLLIPFLCSLVNGPDKHNVSLSEPRYKTFYTRVIWLYAHRFLKTKPLPPATFAREGVSACCSDCAQLSTFLRDPNRATSRFPLAESRLRHLENKLYNCSARCTTDRSVSPHTLVVTKTNDKYEKDLREWERRKQQTEESIGKLGQDALQELFAVQSPAAVLETSAIASALEPKQKVAKVPIKCGALRAGGDAGPWVPRSRRAAARGVGP